MLQQQEFLRLTRLRSQPSSVVCGNDPYLYNLGEKAEVIEDHPLASDKTEIGHDYDGYNPQQPNNKNNNNNPCHYQQKQYPQQQQGQYLQQNQYSQQSQYPQQSQLFDQQQQQQHQLLPRLPPLSSPFHPHYQNQFHQQQEHYQHQQQQQQQQQQYQQDSTQRPAFSSVSAPPPTAPNDMKLWESRQTTEDNKNNTQWDEDDRPIAAVLRKNRNSNSNNVYNSNKSSKYISDDDDYDENNPQNRPSYSATHLAGYTTELARQTQEEMVQARVRNNQNIAMQPLNSSGSANTNGDRNTNSTIIYGTNSSNANGVVMAGPDNGAGVNDNLTHPSNTTFGPSGNLINNVHNNVYSSNINNRSNAPYGDIGNPYLPSTQISHGYNTNMPSANASVGTSIGGTSGIQGEDAQGRWVGAPTGADQKVVATFDQNDVHKSKCCCTIM